MGSSEDDQIFRGVAREAISPLAELLRRLI